MKLLCVDCDAQMSSVDQTAPGDGTLAIVFRCVTCGRRVALLTNPMETQMVGSLCVAIGGRTTPDRPFESVRSQLEGGAERAERPENGPVWSEEAEARLARVPEFVRAMVRRLYSEWAEERGVKEITVDVMDEARSALGLEGL
jgi:hypothetical protein